MAARAGAVFARIVLILVGLVVLVGALLFSRMPRPYAERVEAALDVVGVDTGGSFAWIVKTPNGAVLVDSGMDPDAQALLKELRDEGVQADQVHTILLTHGHQDHWGGASKFPKAKVYVGPGDAALLRGEREPKSALGGLFKKLAKPADPPQQVQELKDEQTVTADGLEFQVVYVPGHTQGSVMYLRNGLLFTGDALMADGNKVTGAPSALSEDADLSHNSLNKLVDLPFTVIADGHTGVAADARLKLRRYLK